MYLADKLHRSLLLSGSQLNIESCWTDGPQMFNMVQLIYSQQPICVYTSDSIYVEKKLASAFYVLSTLNNKLPINILKNVYYTLNHPYLTHGCILWGNTYKKLHKITTKEVC